MPEQCGSAAVDRDEVVEALEVGVGDGKVCSGLYVARVPRCVLNK